MKLVRAWLVPVTLVAGGIIIGVVVASNMGWLPTGTAGPEPIPNPIVRPVATAPQLPMAGGSGKNFVEIAKSVKPAVVNIAATRIGKSGESPHGAPLDDPFFRKFFGDEFFKRDRDAPQREPKERGQGSGVIVEANGLIVTNNHVVNKADEIRVFLPDKREFKGKLIGTDAKTDIAIVKIEATGLPTIPWADSDQLEVGEFVLAVGSPFGLTETKGVLVSDVMEDSPAKKAGFERADVIVEYDGKSMDSPTHLRNAVAQTPIGKKVSVKLIRDKKSKTIEVAIVEQPKSLGQPSAEESRESVAPTGLLSDLEVHELNEELITRYGLKATERGVVVVRVKPGSTAEEMGVREGDVILEVNRKAVGSLKSYEQAASGLAKDQAVLLLLRRKGQTIYLTLRP